MNAKKFLAALVCALMLMQCVAFAADISPEAVVYARPELTSVDINQVGAKIFVDITTENVSNDQPVMAYMYYTGVEDGGYEYGGYENAFGQIYSEYSLRGAAYSPVNAGEAQLEIYPTVSNTRDAYYIAVALYNAGDVYHEKIFYVCEADIEAFMEAVNAVEATDEVKAALKDYYYAISVMDYNGAEKLTKESYEALSDDGKDAFVELIVNGVNGEYSEDKGTFTPENSANFMKEAYLIAAYNEGGFSNADLAELVLKYADVVGIDASEDSVYGKIKNKDTFMKIAKTMNASVDDADELKDVLENAACVQSVNEAYWLNLVDVVEANNDLFGVDEDEIKALQKTKSLRKLFCEEFQGTYYSVKDIKSAWNTAYKAAKKKYEKDSGGTTVSVKDTVVTTNIVLNQITDSQNNYDPNVAILDYYTDMAGYQWSSEAVLNLTKNGVVSGYGDKTFAPGNSLTRAEFTKMLVNVFGLADITATCSFTDVDQNAWYYIYIASAQKYGLAQGYGNGLFGVNDPITRQDAVTLIYRAAQAKGISTQHFYKSATGLKDKDQIAAYAYEAVEGLYNAGVYLDATDPTTVNVFDPTRNASRAYVAVILNQLYIYMN